MIPGATFSARIRSGNPSYLQVTVPYTTEVLSQINDRYDGYLQVERLYPGETATEILWVNLEEIQWDEGAVNKTITLTGHRTFTNNSPASVTVSGCSYIRHSSNKMVRCSPFNDVKPRDTVTAGTVSFIVGLVSINASPANMVINLTEETALVTTTTTTTLSTTTTTGPGP